MFHEGTSSKIVYISKAKQFVCCFSKVLDEKKKNTTLGGSQKHFAKVCTDLTIYTFLPEGIYGHEKRVMGVFIYTVHNV